MGNSNSSLIKETLSLPSWNLSHISVLKENLGSRTPHIYSSYPKQIPEENVYSTLDLRHFSCPDGELLNSFLESIHSHLQVEFVKENWQENAFPSHTDKFKLLEHELKVTNLTEEKMNEFRDIFNLPLTILEEDKSKLETETDTDSEDSKEPVKSIKKEKKLDITQVYSGYTVYEFPANSIGIPLKNKMVTLESCFVGSNDNQLVIIAPSEEPNLTSKIRFEWKVIQVGNEKIKLVLDDARGILFNEENSKITEEVAINHFENLVNAHQSFEANNSREMALYGRRYLTWVQNIQNEGMVQALAGGEIEGEIVSLGEFLDKMKLE